MGKKKPVKEEPHVGTVPLVECDGLYFTQHVGDGSRGNLEFSVAFAFGDRIVVAVSEGKKNRGKFAVRVRDVIEASLDHVDGVDRG